MGGRRCFDGHTCRPVRARRRVWCALTGARRTWHVVWCRVRTYVCVGVDAHVCVCQFACTALHNKDIDGGGGVVHIDGRGCAVVCAAGHNASIAALQAQCAFLPACLLALSNRAVPPRHKIVPSLPREYNTMLFANIGPNTRTGCAAVGSRRGGHITPPACARSGAACLHSAYTAPDKLL